MNTPPFPTFTESRAAPYHRMGAKGVRSDPRTVNPIRKSYPD
nr:hypothetical protein [Methylobacterium sp. J-078]